MSWNKGKKLSKKHRENISKGNIRVGNKPPAMNGEKNVNWKGDKVGYSALHKWVRRMLGTPKRCEKCGDRSLRHRQYHWANVSGKYIRIVADWMRLCAKCHKKFDKKKKNI